MTDRLGIFLPYIKGKDVLDLGCVNHEIEFFMQESCLHSMMKPHCKTITGVDRKREEVAELNTIGYNIICQDVEKLNLKKKYDVIIAGEIIEHLSNPGNMLQSARKYLKDGGRLIITTPNAFSADRSIISLVREDVPTNQEHTFYFTRQTLTELLSRYGFKVEKFHYVNEAIGDAVKCSNRPLLTRVFHLIKQLRPHYKETMIAICKLE